VHDCLPIEENHQHGLHSRLLESKFLWTWQIFFNPCRWMSFHCWIVSKASKFVTSYVIFKWSIIIDHHLNQNLRCSNSVFLLFYGKWMCYKAWENFPLLSPPRFSMTIFRTVSLLMSSSSTIRSDRWQFYSNRCQTFSMLLSVQYNPRVATTPGVVLNIFLPFMKLSIPAKNAGLH
jgi:hypothetical protein